MSHTVHTDMLGYKHLAVDIHMLHPNLGHSARGQGYKSTIAGLHLLVGHLTPHTAGGGGCLGPGWGGCYSGSATHRTPGSELLGCWVETELLGIGVES